jgi:negative regulator of replication initiation
MYIAAFLFAYEKSIGEAASDYARRRFEFRL